MVDVSVQSESAHDDQTLDDAYDLNVDQMAFMFRAWNAVNFALDNDDFDFLDTLTASEDYQTLFGAMSLDQAIDRFEIMAR